MDIKKMIRDMTLAEKASLCSGADFWHTETIDRIGLKGNHGFRRTLRTAQAGGDHQ